MARQMYTFSFLPVRIIELKQLLVRERLSSVHAAPAIRILKALIAQM